MKYNRIFATAIHNGDLKTLIRFFEKNGVIPAKHILYSAEYYWGPPVFAEECVSTFVEDGY